MDGREQRKCVSRMSGLGFSRPQPGVTRTPPATRIRGQRNRWRWRSSPFVPTPVMRDTASRRRRSCASTCFEKFVRKVLIGADPLDREKLWQELAHWQRGSAAQLTDRTLAIVDCALGELAGRALSLPVHKLIGAYRDKVPAYGSIIWWGRAGGGLATPDDYGRFCEKLVARGYRGSSSTPGCRRSAGRRT